MTRVGTGSVFALALLLAFTFAAAASGTASGRATFQYALGARIDGSVSGHCEGHALVPPGGTAGILQLTPARSATLRLFEAWYNYTVVLSETGERIERVIDAHQSEERVDLEPRMLVVSWGQAGRVTVNEFGAPRDNHEPFNASFVAQGARLAPATDAHSSRSTPAQGPERFEEPRTSPIGFARRVETTQPTLDVSGDFTLYLEEAHVQDGDHTRVLPPYRQVTTSGTPLARFVSEHYHYAWLDVAGSSLRTMASGTLLYCGGLEAAVEGVFTAFGAAGHVQAEQGQLAFDHKELSLAGRFRLSESVTQPSIEQRSAPTYASVDGRFDAVGLDFAAVDKPASQTWPVVVSASVGGLALAILGVVILYSRIAEDQILDRPERRRLYEAVTANPGIEFARLLEQNPMSATNARYHLKLLERRGLVRVVSVQGRHRFVPSTLDAQRARQALLLSEDPKLRDLLELLEGEGRPASELVEALRREWGLSRTGGWKVLDRAVRAQLVERLVHQRRVILRRAQ